MTNNGPINGIPKEDYTRLLELGPRVVSATDTLTAICTRASIALMLSRFRRRMRDGETVRTP